MHEDEQQAAERHNGGPCVEDEHRANVRVSHIEQSVMQVLAVGRKWRFSGAQAAKHREREIEQRHNQDRERQQDWNERGDEELGELKLAHIDLAGDRNGRGGHHESDKERAGIAHEQLRGMPVQRQESHAGADEHGGYERGEVEVLGLGDLRRENVAVNEEHAIGDDGYTGHEAVEAVDEVDGVHHEHDGHDRHD